MGLCTQVLTHEDWNTHEDTRSRGASETAPRPRGYGFLCAAPAPADPSPSGRLTTPLRTSGDQLSLGGQADPNSQPRSPRAPRWPSPNLGPLHRRGGR